MEKGLREPNDVKKRFAFEDAASQRVKVVFAERFAMNFGGSGPLLRRRRRVGGAAERDRRRDAVN